VTTPPQGVPTEPVQAPAWHTASFNRNTPGVLTLADGRLSFASEDPRRTFDVALSEVGDIRFGYRDSVMKCTVAGTKYRFYFSRPRGAAMPAAGLSALGGIAGDLGGALGGVAAVQGAKGFLESRAAGKAFKAALQP
jgi:hypothetical protein